MFFNPEYFYEHFNFLPNSLTLIIIMSISALYQNFLPWLFLYLNFLVLSIISCSLVLILRPISFGSLYYFGLFSSNFSSKFFGSLYYSRLFIPNSLSVLFDSVYYSRLFNPDSSSELFSSWSTSGLFFLKRLLSS